MMNEKMVAVPVFFSQVKVLREKGLINEPMTESFEYSSFRQKLWIPEYAAGLAAEFLKGTHCQLELNLRLAKKLAKEMPNVRAKFEPDSKGKKFLLTFKSEEDCRKAERFLFA